MIFVSLDFGKKFRKYIHRYLIAVLITGYGFAVDNIWTDCDNNFSMSLNVVENFFRILNFFYIKKTQRCLIEVLF